MCDGVFNCLIGAEIFTVIAVDVSPQLIEVNILCSNVTGGPQIV